MKLYKVTCTCKTNYSESSMDLYVIAANVLSAELMALATMKDADYKFDDYVKNIELLADDYKYGGPAILVIAMEEGGRHE